MRAGGTEAQIGEMVLRIMSAAEARLQDRVLEESGGESRDQVGDRQAHRQNAYGWLKTERRPPARPHLALRFECAAAYEFGLGWSRR